MGESSKEVPCGNGKVSISQPGGQAEVRCGGHEPVQVDCQALHKVVKETENSRGLIANDVRAQAVDSRGHQVELTVHHRPDALHSNSWAHLKVDSVHLELDSYQLSNLRAAL